MIKHSFTDKGAVVAQERLREATCPLKIFIKIILRYRTSDCSP